MNDTDQIKQRMDNAEMALFSIATILEKSLSAESKRSISAESKRSIDDVMEMFLKRFQELDSIEAGETLNERLNG